MEADGDRQMAAIDNPLSSNPVRGQALVKIDMIRETLASTIDYTRARCPAGDPDGRGWKPVYYVLIKELDVLSDTLALFGRRLLAHDVVYDYARGRAEFLAPILEGADDISRTWIPRLEEDAASGHHNLAVRLIVEVVWHDLQLTSALRSTKTGDEMLLYLTLIDRSPPNNFWTTIGRIVQDDKRIASFNFLAPNHYPDNDPAAHDPAAMFRPVNIIMSPLFQEDPCWFLTEKLTYRIVSHFEPQFSNAVIGWLQFANTHWPSIRPIISHLFNPANVNNFTYLVLEYARARWPELYGWDAKDTSPRTKLTIALCSGDISPLHFAAALGLSDMCTDILLQGVMDPNQRSDTLITPLWCALIGDQMIPWRTCGEKFPDSSLVDIPYKGDQAITISQLLGLGADCTGPVNWENGATSTMTMTNLAFKAALQSHHPVIWYTYLALDPKLDRALASTISKAKPRAGDIDSRSVLAKLITALLDHILTDDRTVYQEIRQVVENAIATCMENNKLDFEPHSPQQQGTLRLLNVSDPEYFNQLRNMLLENNVLCFQRLLLDPRFEPNPIDDGVDTMLHLAVADDYFAIVKLLLERGASLEMTDSAGRTPLMVIDSPEMLALLVWTYGAKTTATDNLGRNIWHLAAGSNDRDLMRWLCCHDPSRKENMTVRTLEGNTPLAESLLYLRQLAQEPLSSTNRRHPRAARELIKRCDDMLDDQSFWCNTHIAHLAAEWGCLDIIDNLDRLGADFTALNSNAQSVLYKLTLSASPRVVSRLQELVGESSPIVSNSITPAEAIFLNTRIVYHDGVPHATAHPSCSRPLSATTYNRLLTPETLAWQDGNGLGLWERFCRDIIMQNPIPQEPSLAEPMSFFHQSIETALQCLINAGCLKEYERRTNKPAISCFNSQRLHAWFYDSNLDDEWASTSVALNKGPVWRPAALRWWNVTFFEPYFLPILTQSSEEVMDAFYKSDDAVSLIREARRENHVFISAFLYAKGVRGGNEENEDGEGDPGPTLYEDDVDGMAYYP